MVSMWTSRKHARVPSLAIFALLLVMPACGDRAETEAGGQTEAPATETPSPDPAATAPDAVAQEYAPELEVSLAQMTRSPSGLHTQDLQEGSGATAEAGKTVVVHYTGWLPNGEKFDSSRDHDQPFDFRLGSGSVIQGWDEGVAGMKVGGRRKLVIPPALAYGAPGRPGIPPNATLVFDVELLEVR